MGTPEEKAYRPVQIFYIRELRLAKTPETLKKASEVLAKVMGEPAPPIKKGWGRTDLIALKELGILMEAKGEWKEAFAHWVPLVTQLSKKVESQPRLKEHYFECYFHMALAYYKLGEGNADPAKREKGIEAAAKHILTFEKRWDGFGDEASQKRFTELLGQEAPLREEYEKQKKAAGPSKKSE
jgi:hypothetical protein